MKPLTHRRARTGALRPVRPALSEALVIDTARRVLAEEGLDALSLRGVAARLGVTAPALYAHVDDKLDLLRRLAEDGFRWLLQRIDPLPPLDPASKIQFAARAYLEFARNNPAQFRVMYLFPPRLDAGSFARVVALSRDAVREAVEAGLIESEDLHLTHLTIFSAVHGITLAVLAGTVFGREGQDRLMHDVVQALLRGLEPTG